MIPRTLALMLFLSGCEDEPPIVISDQRPRTVRDGRPEGYPVGFPVVPGARVIEGAVDPGVVRTSALEYEGDCAALEQSLREAMTTHTGRVIAREALSDGTVSLRVSLADKEASFSMRAELTSCILRTISSDRPDAPSR